MGEFINPAIVPKVKVYTGEEIPGMGIGTFGSDRVSAEEVSNAVAGALRSGYRMFDCAACYGNEDQIGKVFQAAFDEGVVERKELFIMSKVLHHDKSVERHARESRGVLQKEYCRPAVRLHRPLLYPLAVPELSCAGMRCGFQKSGFQAFLCGEIYEDLETDGASGGYGPDQAYRYVKYDYPQA